MKSIIGIVALLVVANFAFSADIEAGKNKAVSCVACHGKDGFSSAPNFPNLACQKDKYLVKQLKDFRDGTRSDPVMVNFAKPLSDADIDNLASYYSQLPCGK